MFQHQGLRANKQGIILFIRHSLLKGCFFKNFLSKECFRIYTAMAVFCILS